MPRPANGYTNAAGLPIPGTSDITKRFMNRERLLYWAFSRGKQGHAKLYDDSALDIGTAVHAMAELDLKGEPQRDIDFYLTTTLRDPEQQAKGKAAFGAFRAWRDEFHVRAHIQEVSLVSEKLQFGGTLDTIAAIRNGLGLIDFKTTNSGEVYEDHVLQLAAYGILWEETHPEAPLTSGYHLIMLPKDGSKPIHREFTHDALHPFRQKFWCYRKAFELDAVCNDPKVLKGIAVAPSTVPDDAPPKRKARASKPSPQPTTTCAHRSMAEILRSYGHVREGARV